MKIDVQCHLFTKNFAGELKKIRANILLEPADEIGVNWIYDKRLGFRLAIYKEDANQLDTRIKHMDKYGIDTQLLSTAYPAVDRLEANDAVRLAKIANDDLADVCEKYPGRFLASTTLPLQDVESSLEELDRAVLELGHKAVFLFSTPAGKSLDSPELLPFFERVEKLNVPILLHPAFPLTDKASGKNYEIWPNLQLLRDHDLAIIFGWPFDTTIALTRLALGGVLEKYAKLKIIGAHMGGMIPFYKERLNLLYTQYHPNLPRLPSDYFKNVYFDTAVYDSSAIMCGYNYLGANHIVFATDYPFGPGNGETAIRRSVEAINELKVSAEEKAMIFGQNTAKLLKIQ